MDTISFKFSWARAVAMVVGAITMCYQASYAAAILEGQRMHPVDDNGNARSKMSRYTHLAAGVPGTVAGLIMALDQYGTITLKELTSKKYAKFLRDKIDTKKATPSNTIAPGKPLPLESNETTHFSIVDKFGNAVANTYTINFSYGSGIVVEGAGFLLNNEMEL